MSGYAARTHPSTGVLHPLWAKALALEDNKGSRIVIVTTDLIGLPRAITDLVAARTLQQYDLERAHLLFNSSHTHTGPVVPPVIPNLVALTPEDREITEAYSRKLADNLFTIIGAALGKLAPAQISYGLGKAHFAINRRDPKGPVDPDVPVLRVNAVDGSPLAILFGYACHNTTLTAEFYELSGDYAGFTEIELERTHPGAAAMFLMLTGGDQNPNPRSSVDLARQHGHALATEVDRVLASTMTQLKPPIHAAFQNIELNFALTTRETFEGELKDANPAKVRRAQAMLKAYNERHPVRQTLYPIQAIRFGTGLTILALGGEVVVDYSLRAKREYPGDLIVAGYSNDLMSYIPSERVLHEGGYEAVDSMIYYGQPGPFAGDVEERIFEGIHRVMRAVGHKQIP